MGGSYDFPRSVPCPLGVFTALGQCRSGRVLRGISIAFPGQELTLDEAAERVRFEFSYGAIGGGGPVIGLIDVPTPVAAFHLDFTPATGVASGGGRAVFQGEAFHPLHWKVLSEAVGYSLLVRPTTDGVYSASLLVTAIWED